MFVAICSVTMVTQRCLNHTMHTLAGMVGDIYFLSEKLCYMAFIVDNMHNRHHLLTGTDVSLNKVDHFEKPLSHQAPIQRRWHGVVLFSRAPLDRKKALIVFIKKGLSRGPYSDHGIATELGWHSIRFLRSSCWQFSALLPCFHGAHNSCSA